MSKQSDGGTDAPAEPSSLLSNQYALLWDLADEMAKKDGTDPVRCWSQIMDAYWSGELPDLFCFIDNEAVSRLPDEPMEFPSRDLAMGYLHGTLVDPQTLRGWRPEDYRTNVRSWVERNPRFGLAIRRADFERWRVRYERSTSPARFEPTVSRSSAAAPAVLKKPGRRGPEPGRVDRYGKVDRALFKAIDELISTGQVGSVRAAALRLAEQGKISGEGTVENRAKRVERKYFKHRNSIPKLDPIRSH
jgi:hypothetical protein